MCSENTVLVSPNMKDRSPSSFKRTLNFIPMLLLCMTTLHTPAHATSYTTNFPKTEPLISEGGHWITAGTAGVDWHATLCGGKGDRHVASVSTTPGYASPPTEPGHFGDALALLTGNWKPDQTAQATVRVVSPSGWPEAEIRLRTSPKDATGYEIMWSAKKDSGERYLAIATWDGPSSAEPHYTILKSLKGAEYGVVTGDVIKGTIIGNTITAYKNGKLQFTITNDKFSHGNPGFGFNEGPSGIYGITSFSASDDVSQAHSEMTAIPGKLRASGDQMQTLQDRSQSIAAGSNTSIVISRRPAGPRNVQSLPVISLSSPARIATRTAPAQGTSRPEIQTSPPCRLG
jgi:hypothetical protein